MNEYDPKEKQSNDWSFAMWRAVFGQLDKDCIIRYVRRLRQKYPGEDQASLATRVVKRSANLSATAGIVSVSSALLPGIGIMTSMAGLVPEEVYLVRRKCAMLLELAALYGLDVNSEDRLTEIVILAQTQARVYELLRMAKADFSRFAVRAATTVSRESGRASQVGTRLLSQRAVRVLPALGMVAGGAINYCSFRSLGRKVVSYYALKQPEVTTQNP